MSDNEKMTWQEQIKQIRAKRGPATDEQKERSKNQIQRQKTILATIAAEPKTVPDIAAETGIPAPEVFWWITALRKYDRVVEDTKKRGEYRAYRKKEADKK